MNSLDTRDAMEEGIDNAENNAMDHGCIGPEDMEFYEHTLCVEDLTDEEFENYVNSNISNRPSDEEIQASVADDLPF